MSKRTLEDKFKDAKRHMEESLREFSSVYKLLKAEIEAPRTKKLKVEKKEKDKKIETDPVAIANLHRGFTCAGRIWENKPCEGCKSCNTAVNTSYQREGIDTKPMPFIQCKTCKQQLTKYKKKKRVEMKNKK